MRCEITLTLQCSVYVAKEDGRNFVYGNGQSNEMHRKNGADDSARVQYPLSIMYGDVGLLAVDEFLADVWFLADVCFLVYGVFLAYGLFGDL